MKITALETVRLDEFPIRACVHLSLSVPNTLVQESVRAFYTGWYRELVTESRSSTTAGYCPRRDRVSAPSSFPASTGARMRTSR